MMKKFIFKSIMFTLPFFIAYFLILNFGVTDEGDLLRIGNIVNSDKAYRKIFKTKSLSDTLYTNFHDIEKKQYTILSLGDSFSNQGNIGYQNFLSENPDISVLHFNQSSNSVEKLYSFINGGVFDSLQVKYVLLQSVERHFLERANNFDSTAVINLNSAINLDMEAINLNNKIIKKSKQKPPFFSRGTLTFSRNNLLYPLDDNAFFSNVYDVNTDKKLFSIEDNKLLFYSHDLLNMANKNGAMWNIVGNQI